MSKPAGSDPNSDQPGKAKRSDSGFGKLLTLAGWAAAGAGLITVPSIALSMYEQASGLGPIGQAAFVVVTGAGGTLLLGAGGLMGYRIWRNTARRKAKRRQQSRNPSEMSAGQIQDEIGEHRQQLQEIVDDEHAPPEVRRQIRELAERLERKQTERALELVAFGTVSSGKSSLLNTLAGKPLFETAVSGGTTTTRGEVDWPELSDSAKATLVDTPGIGEAYDIDHGALAREAARDADLILFVVEGPLRDSEFQTLSLLGEMEKRILVCLNKADWYSPQDREELLDQIREQVRNLVRPEDVVWVQSRTVQRERIRVKPDGTQVKEMVDVPPDIGPLAKRMVQTINKDGQSLLLANLLLRSRAVVYEAREKVRGALDEEAARIVDRYTWGGAGAAAVLPGLGVDLAVAAGVSVKMVAELATLYKQPIDMATIRKMLSGLPKQLLAVVGANALTPLAGGIVASGLKTIPGVGTVAGGVLQGLTQAVVIRWFGRVFITYFRQEMTEPPGGLAMLARQKWDEVTRPAALAELIRTGLTHLRSVTARDDEPDRGSKLPADAAREEVSHR